MPPKSNNQFKRSPSTGRDFTLCSSMTADLRCQQLDQVFYSGNISFIWKLLQAECLSPTLCGFVTLEAFPCLIFLWEWRWDSLTFWSCMLQYIGLLLNLMVYWQQWVKAGLKDVEGQSEMLSFCFWGLYLWMLSSGAAKWCCLFCFQVLNRMECVSILPIILIKL